MDKIELRKRMLNKRRLVKNKGIKSKRIVNKILCSQILNNFNIIGLYYPLEDEVDIRELIISFLNNHKVVCLPKVINGRDMCFIKINSLQELELGRFNLHEPLYDESNIIKASNIELFIIPGLAFDTDKNRLGYGKGYYDRYLYTLKTHKIGVTFKELYLHSMKIPADSHDVKMDEIITD